MTPTDKIRRFISLTVAAMTLLGFAVYARAQQPIPERMIKHLVSDQLRLRKSLAELTQYCKSFDQVVVAAPEGIVIASTCGPKPAPPPAPIGIAKPETPKTEK